MIYFVTGIDTDIGKTYATGMLARYLQERRCRVITQKMVQTGNVGYSEDLELHRRLMGGVRFPEDDEKLTWPAVFRFPASPHLAAELEGRTVDLPAIAAATRELDRRYDIVLVEGAGGPGVPLTRDLYVADYLAQQQYPVILVTSGRLGSISHTFLALEAFARRGVTVCGLVYNLAAAADPVIAGDTRTVLLGQMRRFGFPEILVELPEVRPDKPAAAPDFSAIFAGGGHAGR